MDPRYLVIHHSESTWGDAAVIDKWHKDRGWSRIGYHKVILNGYPTYKHRATGNYLASADGKIQQGRADDEVGAHCKDGQMNYKSLGLCMIGNFDGDEPTEKQKEALTDACARLCMRHGIHVDHICFHNDFADKTCPGRRLLDASSPMSRARLRAAVQERIDAYQG